MSTQTARLSLEYVKTIGLTTNQSGRGFINPYDMAVSRDGRIFVLNHCDSARKNLIRIGIMNFDEDYLGEFGNGAAPEMASSPPRWRWSSTAGSVCT